MCRELYRACVYGLIGLLIWATACTPSGGERVALLAPPLPALEVLRAEQIDYLSQHIQDEAQVPAHWYARRGLLHLQNRKENLAIADLEAALAQESQRPHWWLGLAKAYLIKRDTTKALSAAHQAERLHESSPDLYKILAQIYFGKREFLRSVRYWEQFQETFPEDGTAFLMSGRAFVALGDTSEALYRFGQALCYAQDSMPAYLDILDVHLSGNQWFIARSVARQIRDRLPTNAEWAYRYAHIQRYLGKPDSAFLLWQQAVADDSTFVPAQRDLADFYFQRKAYTLALPHLEAVLRYRPKDPLANQYMGHLDEYRKLDYTQASQRYQTALQTDSLNPYLQQSLRRIAWKQRRDSLRALGLWREPDTTTTTTTND